MNKKVIFVLAFLSATLFLGHFTQASAATLIPTSDELLIRRFCSKLLDDVPSNGTAECDQLRNHCADTIQSDAEDNAKKDADFGDLRPITSGDVSAIAQKEKGKLEDSENAFSEKLSDACAPLPPTPPENTVEQPSEPKGTQEIVAQPAQPTLAINGGGCIMSGFGGDVGNLWIAAVGLIPLALKRRK